MDAKLHLSDVPPMLVDQLQLVHFVCGAKGDVEEDLVGASKVGISTVRS